MVWLYNSLELDLDGQTTCEVFDFATNTWRHVTGSTHRILLKAPVYLDGSIYWLTHKYNGETKIVYFDFHTEVFQVMAATPVVHASSSCIVIFSLNNHLCVSEKKINSQEIWSLNSHKIWEKTYNINLSLFGGLDFPVTPVTLISKTELLLFFPYANYPCLTVQRVGSSYSSYYSSVSSFYLAVPFIPSLISI